MIQQQLIFEPKKISLKEQIYNVLLETGKPLASHEFFKYGIITNDHTVSARLNELERAEKVISRFRDGKRYKEWLILSSMEGGN